MSVFVVPITYLSSKHAHERFKYGRRRDETKIIDTEQKWYCLDVCARVPINNHIIIWTINCNNSHTINRSFLSVVGRYMKKKKERNTQLTLIYSPSISILILTVRDECRSTNWCCNWNWIDGSSEKAYVHIRTCLI